MYFVSLWFIDISIYFKYFQTEYVPLLNHRRALINSVSWVSYSSWQCCTKTRWLVQVTTWVWALTNGICCDRRLLLRHLRGFKKRKKETCHYSPSTISLTLVCLFICSASSSSGSYYVLRVTALPACYWLLAGECSSAVSGAFALWATKSRPSLTTTRIWSPTSPLVFLLLDIWAQPAPAAFSTTTSNPQPPNP